MRYSIGIDLRKYKGYHYRVLNNLMGFDAYYSTGNKNSAGRIIETTVEAVHLIILVLLVQKSITTTLDMLDGKGSMVWLNTQEIKLLVYYK